MAYLVSDSDNPANHPIYVVEEGLGSCMLHLSNEDTYSVLQVEIKGQSITLLKKKMNCGRCTSMALHLRKEQEMELFLFPLEEKMFV